MIEGLEEHCTEREIGGKLCSGREIGEKSAEREIGVTLC